MERNPSLQRLVLWRQLERTHSAFASEVDAWAVKRTRLEAEQEAGLLRSDVDAADILALVLVLTQTWFLAPEALLGPSTPATNLEATHSARRTVIVNTVQRVLEAR